METFFRGTPRPDDGSANECNMQPFAAYIDYQPFKVCSLLQPTSKWAKCSLLQPYFFSGKIRSAKTYG